MLHCIYRFPFGGRLLTISESESLYPGTIKWSLAAFYLFLIVSSCQSNHQTRNLTHQYIYRIHFYR